MTQTRALSARGLKKALRRARVLDQAVHITLLDWQLFVGRTEQARRWLDEPTMIPLRTIRTRFRELCTR